MSSLGDQTARKRGERGSPVWDRVFFAADGVPDGLAGGRIRLGGGKKTLGSALRVIGLQETKGGEGLTGVGIVFFWLFGFRVGWLVDGSGWLVCGPGSWVVGGSGGIFDWEGVGGMGEMERGKKSEDEKFWKDTG